MIPTDPLPSPDEVSSLDLRDVELNLQDQVCHELEEIDETPLNVGEITGSSGCPEQSGNAGLHDSAEPSLLRTDPHTGELVFRRNLESEPNPD